MSYPKQTSVAERLTVEMHQHLDALQRNHQVHLRMLWSRTRSELQNAVSASYRHAAPAGKWSLPAFHMSGAYSHVSMLVQGSLRRFHALAQNEMKTALGEMRRASQLRYAYILDQTTPESRRILVPTHATAREADVPDNTVKWSDRLSTWTDIYGTALLANLRMGAMNGSELSNAMDEVDATRVNTPASTLENALLRLYEWNAVASIDDGAQDITTLNDDLVEEEIWKTRGDMAVCEDCDANEGLPLDEADGMIPLHPRCHCYRAVVPVEYAELLRSGNEDDQALARLMQAKNLVPFSMVIRGEDGGIAAKATVSYESWQQGQQIVAGGR